MADKVGKKLGEMGKSRWCACRWLHEAGSPWHGWKSEFARGEVAVARVEVGIGQKFFRRQDRFSPFVEGARTGRTGCWWLLPGHGQPGGVWKRQPGLFHDCLFVWGIAGGKSDVISCSASGIQEGSGVFLRRLFRLSSCRVALVFSSFWM